MFVCTEVVSIFANDTSCFLRRCDEILPFFQIHALLTEFHIILTSHGVIIGGAGVSIFSKSSKL